MSELKTLLAPYAARAEAEMQRQLPPLEPHRGFYGQLYYHLGWADESFAAADGPRGKRVRAAFCLMSCEALSGDADRALPAAAATELLHEFSLIHDDIEDGDASRRHRPTLWTLVGVPQAINAGDGLFAVAQNALLASAARGVPAATVLRAQRAFNETALRLCLGQYLDMSFEARAVVSPDEYLEMIGGKTGALLAFAGQVGALVAGAGDDDVAALHAVGEAMGLAFQMQDDLLGLWGDPARTGKPIGADVRAKKKSLPVAYALSQPESERLRALYAGPLHDDEAVREATHLIEATGAREVVQGMARAQSDRALAALDRVSAPTSALASLRRLVTLLLQRDH